MRDRFRRILRRPKPLDPIEKRRRRRRRWRNAGLVLLGLVTILVFCTWISTDRFRAFGGSPDDETLARMRASPRFVEDHFENAEPTVLAAEGSVLDTTTQFFFGDEMRAPECELPLHRGGAERLRVPPASGLRITWLGHSTTLVEIDGARVLTDPMWSERSSPSTWVGPTRFHVPPIAIADLPRIDAVVVSHDHYDHLDMETCRALAERGAAFHVPLGLRAHLETWGVPRAQITEHDWWEDAELEGGVRLVSTPSRHFCGRGNPWSIGTLWTSWAIVGPRHRVYFSGDTGLTEQFREIAAREGPFDVALLEIGQYHPNWGDIHLGPEGALEANEMLGARTLFPVHWSTFELGFHDWSEPAETLTRLARERSVTLATPMLGEPYEIGMTTSAWWRSLPPLAARCPE